MILAQGTHESTFLALEALESNIATGRTREERGKASQRNPSTCLARQNRSGRSDILHQILQWSNGVQRSVMTKRAIVVWRRILNYEGLLRKRKARRQKKQKKTFLLEAQQLHRSSDRQASAASNAHPRPLPWTVPSLTRIQWKSGVEHKHCSIPQVGCQ